MRLSLKPVFFDEVDFIKLGSNVNELLSEIKSLGKEVFNYYGKEIKKKGLSIQVEKGYLGDKLSYPIVIRKKVKKGWFRHEWVFIGNSNLIDNYATEEHYKGLIHTPYTMTETLGHCESQAFVYAICVLTDRLKDVNYDSQTMREKCVDYITLVSLLTIAKSIGSGKQDLSCLNSQLGIPDSYKNFCKNFSIYFNYTKTSTTLVSITAGNLFRLVGELNYDSDRTTDRQLYKLFAFSYTGSYQAYNLFGKPILNS